MAVIRIPDATAFNLRITGQHVIGEYTEDVSFGVLSNLIVNFIRLGREAQIYTIDASGRIVADNDGTLARGKYGVELFGYYNGQPWRYYEKNVFQIVNSSSEHDSGTEGEETLTYDITFQVSFGGTGITSAFVDAAIAAHNNDEAAHDDIRDELADRIVDVQVDGVSIVDGNKVAQIHHDDFGYVDDVKVDGVSVVNNDKIANLHTSDFGSVSDVLVNGSTVVSSKVANITVPTAVSQLTNDSDYQTGAEVAAAVAESAIGSVDVSVDNNIGTPSAEGGVLNNELSIAFHNLKGNGIASVVQTTTSAESGGANVTTVTMTDGTTGTITTRNGEKGDTVVIGDEDTYTLYNFTGENSDGAMTQAAVTRELGKLGERCMQYGSSETLTKSQITWGRYTASSTTPVTSITRVMGIVPCEGYDTISFSIGTGYYFAIAQFSIAVEDGDFAHLDQRYIINGSNWLQSGNVTIEPNCKTARILIKNASDTTLTIAQATSTMGDVVLASGAATFTAATPYSDFAELEASSAIVEKIVTDGYARNVVDSDSNMTTFGTAATCAWSGDELVISESASANGGFALRDFPQGGTYIVTFSAKSTYDGQILQVGDGATMTGSVFENISLSTTYQKYVIDLESLALTPLALTLLAANVHVGATITMTNIVVYVKGGQSSAQAIPITFNTESFLQSVSRKDKYLVKIACEGDSLIANAIGGDIPSNVDEGATMRPMRMLTNNVPRRLYDYMSWNKPVWRRLDNADWTISGFSATTSWSGTVFHGTNEKYHYATSAGAYCEITIPDGYEHFALIARTKAGNGVLSVTINGLSPSSVTYNNPILGDNPERTVAQLTALLGSNSVVNTSVCPITLPCGDDTIDLNQGTSSTGNPYAIFEFNNLPEGDNVIRFTTAGAAECDVWGGFYWSGNTLVVMNIAHGGKTTSDLLANYLQDELYNAGYDAILFEITEMNNARLTLDTTATDIESIIETLESLGIDHCFTSCNPLGLSIVHDTNFWFADNIVTDQLTINNKVREIMAAKAQPFVDLFQYYRWHIENRGGTLAGGEGGLWYTWDGQHGNPRGVTMWADCLKDIIANKPIMID